MFMVFIPCFRSSSIQHDVNLVNGPFMEKVKDAGDALGREYLVIDRSLPESYTVYQPHGLLQCICCKK